MDPESVYWKGKLEEQRAEYRALKQGQRLWTAGFLLALAVGVVVAFLVLQ